MLTIWILRIKLQDFDVKKKGELDKISRIIKNLDKVREMCPYLEVSQEYENTKAAVQQMESQPDNEIDNPNIRLS